MIRPLLSLIFVAALCAAAAAEAPTPATSISFARDVRPILAAKCFPCHGPDEQARQGELRLDEETQWQVNRDGKQVISPGKPQESELFRRISSSDPAERMPPADAVQQLTAAEIEKL